jgi:ankyrin repeat protein
MVEIICSHIPAVPHQLGSRSHIPMTNKLEQLFRAVAEKDVDRLRQLLEAGADVNAHVDGGRTILMQAALRGDNVLFDLIQDKTTIRLRLEIVRTLIQAGANVNARDSGGRTALMFARYCPDVVEILIQAGADICVQDNQGNTALMMTAEVESGRLLLAAGCDANARNHKGRTALMYTTDVESIRLLLEAGCNVITRDNDGKTALDLAVKMNAGPEVLELLLKVPGVGK